MQEKLEKIKYFPNFSCMFKNVVGQNWLKIGTYMQKPWSTLIQWQKKRDCKSDFQLDLYLSLISNDLRQLQ